MLKRNELIFDLLVDHSTKIGKKVALVDGTEKITYEQLLESVITLGRALLGAGIKPGDRIATLAPPCRGFWICFLACAAIGATWLGLNPRYKRREFAFFIRDAKPKLIFTFSPFDGRNYDGEIEMILKDLNLDKDCKLVQFDDKSFNFTDFSDFLAQHWVLASEQLFHRSTIKVKDTDIAAIVYTSGSTGRPKGSMLSHRSLCRSAKASVGWMGQSLERAAMAFPINHIGSLSAIGMNVLAFGGTVYFMAHFRAADILAIGKKEKITFAGHNETTFQMLLESPQFEIEQMSSLKLLIHGGSKTYAETLRKFLPLNTNISSVYAQTETCGYVLRSNFDASLEEMTNTIGKPIEGVEARICATDSYQDLGEGKIGELQLRFDWPFSGYLNDEFATKTIFTHDQFLKTGDLCMRRKDGNYEFIDRINNTFKSGGHTIYPTEIETVILEHPNVSMAAIVAVEDEKFGNIGFGFLTAKDDVTIDCSEIYAWLKKELANYKVPKKLKIMDSLPKLANTKIDRQRLLEIAYDDA